MLQLYQKQEINNGNRSGESRQCLKHLLFVCRVFSINRAAFQSVNERSVLICSSLRCPLGRCSRDWKNKTMIMHFSLSLSILSPTQISLTSHHLLTNLRDTAALLVWSPSDYSSQRMICMLFEYHTADPVPTVTELL